MSLPKEPRQLLINLMYIVLTALLALNVSAEVLHAFFTMDKSLGESNRLVDGANRQLADAISEQAKAYTQYKAYADKSAEAQVIAKSFFDFVGKMKEEVVVAAGGIGKDGMPKRKADKDVTTRLLVKEGRGNALQNEVLGTREKLLALVDEPGARQAIANAIPLKINDLPENSEKKTWAQFTFQQLPVAAVMPMLTKFQNDVKVAETAILNHFAGKMSMEYQRPDQFAAVISADKSYVIRGEEFRGEIFLAAYSSTADNLDISVDGRSLSVQDGKAMFVANASGIGTKQHEMSIRLTNPLTGQTETFKKQFSYEVGERSVTVSADKMNVLYVGVENPISVSAAGVSSASVKVSAEGTELTNVGFGKYIAKPQKTGKAVISVSGNGMKPVTFEYRIKRIPDPIIVFGRSRGGNLEVAHFKVYDGPTPLLEGFDFQAKAEIMGYELVRLRKGDVAFTQNKGRKYSTEAQRLVDGAQRGDVFYFNDVLVRCPGDIANRNLGSIVFTMK